MASMRGAGKEELEAAAAAFLAQVATPAAPARLKDYGLQRVWARADTYEDAKAPAPARRAYRNPALLRHVLVVCLVVLMVLLVSTTGAYAFSYNAQPDSPLYGTKIFFERARVTLTPSSAEDIRLEMRYSERRMKELQGMVDAGNQKGAERWLREYRRNIEGAGVLFESLSAQEAEQLSSQFQEMLERQGQMMQGMRHGQPSGLSGSIEGAYQVCGQERMRMRQRCGQEDSDSPSQQPGEPQRKGNCPSDEGTSTPQETPSGGSQQMNGGETSGGTAASPYPSQATGSSTGESGSATNDSGSQAGYGGSAMDGSGQALEETLYQGEGQRRGCMP